MKYTNLGFIINRDPPDFWEIRGLTKVYLDSSENFRSLSLEIREFSNPLKNGVILNERTAVTWWNHLVPRLFDLDEGDLTASENPPWMCLLLDLEGIVENVEGKPIVYPKLGPDRCLKAFGSWRKAIYEALLFESRRFSSQASVAEAPTKKAVFGRGNWGG